jgi:polar amino acid transport system substrate-binding protein
MRLTVTIGSGSGRLRAAWRGIVSALGLACLAAPGRAEERVTLHFNERPPYMVPAADGSASGLSATPARQAFAAAGIAVRWAQTPTTRQLAVIRDNEGLDCAIGWFRKPDRETFAKFSKPIYRDRPTVVLANSAFVPERRLADLLRRSGVRVLVKDNFSYGAMIDTLLAEKRASVLGTSAENQQMVRMVAERRVDMMFAAEEEAQHLLSQAGIAPQALQVLRFDDVPSGERRHLMCSKRVPDALIERLNAAIPAID